MLNTSVRFVPNILHCTLSRMSSYYYTYLPLHTILLYCTKTDSYIHSRPHSALRARTPCAPSARVWHNYTLGARRIRCAARVSLCRTQLSYTVDATLGWLLHSRLGHPEGHPVCSLEAFIVFVSCGVARAYKF